MENNTVVFEEKASTTAINLEQLKQTQTLTDYSGHLPKNLPIEHYQLIEMVQEKLAKAGISQSIDPIYVSKSDSKRVMVLDPDRIGALPSWLFGRLVARIQMNGILSDGEYNSSIAIGYNAHGLSLAWGTNVRVCTNMCIYGSNLVRTYGNDKYSASFEKMLNVLNDWIEKRAEIREADLMVFKQLKEIQLEPNSVAQLIGELQLIAVKQAYIDSKVNAPLNIGQCSEFSKRYLKDFTGDKLGTAYDLYSMGTNILLPMNTDIANVWRDNIELGNFFLQKYAIPYADVIS